MIILTTVMISLPCKRSLKQISKVFPSVKLNLLEKCFSFNSVQEEDRPGTLALPLSFKFNVIVDQEVNT